MPLEAKLVRIRLHENMRYKALENSGACGSLGV